MWNGAQEDTPLPPACPLGKVCGRFSPYTNRPMSCPLPHNQRKRSRSSQP